MSYSTSDYTPWFLTTNSSRHVFSQEDAETVIKEGARDIVVRLSGTESKAAFMVSYASKTDRRVHHTDVYLRAFRSADPGQAYGTVECLCLCFH